MRYGLGNRTSSRQRLSRARLALQSCSDNTWRTQRIFISYRRRDTGPVVDRIFDVLATVFGQENVFRDLQSIDAGVPFDEAVQRSISRCNVFLAIIGLSWLSEFEGAERRLDRPNDPVRLEIEAALRT